MQTWSLSTFGETASFAEAVEFDSTTRKLCPALKVAKVFLARPAIIMLTVAMPSNDMAKKECD
jgi:hypothetical protein